MANENLFSILSRSPWWLSALIAGILFAGVRVFLPDFAAFFAALPFLAIAGYAGWRQLRTPSSAKVAEVLERARAMSWDDFSEFVSTGFSREGYSVTRLAGGAADLELRRKGRVTIVSCRRWKVAQTGVGPLRELVKAMREHDAHECAYVAAGEFSAQARTYASEKSVRLLSSAALADLLGRAQRPRWALFRR